MALAWNHDDESCQLVLRAVYGLAKGRDGVSVSLVAAAMQTGLDEADVQRAAGVMERDGWAVLMPGSARVALTPAGAAAAKTDAERESEVVFADGR